MRLHPVPRHAARHIQGFTLVELMVAVALGLLLLGALSALVTATVNNRTELDKTANRVENTRYALEVIGRDAELAGFIGESGKAWTYEQKDPPKTQICPAQNNPEQYGYEVLPDVSLPTPVQIITTGPDCLAEEHWKSDTQILLITRVSTAKTKRADAQAGKMYVQVSNCNEDVSQIVAAVYNPEQPAAFDLRTITCGRGSNPDKGGDTGGNASTGNGGANEGSGNENPWMPLREVIHRLYFVSECNRCGKDEIPTLKVLDYAAGKPTVTALAEGIDQLQLRAGFDHDHDGTPDITPNGIYLTAPTAPTVWADAITLSIEVTACDVEAPGNNNKRTCASGPQHRRKAQLTVRLHNPANVPPGVPRGS